MSLFKQQSEQNMKDSKKAMQRVHKKLITKHVKLQASLLAILTGANAMKECCLDEAISTIAKETAEIEMQAKIIAEGYHMAFGEKLNIRKITEAAMRKHLSVAFDDSKPNLRNLGEDVRDEDIPEEIRDAINQLKSTLGASDAHSAVRVKRMSPEELGESYGIRPEDFGSFNEFFAAVKRAAKGTLIDMDEKGEKTIKDAVIRKVEGEMKSTPKPKRRGSDDDIDKSKMN